MQACLQQQVLQLQQLAPQALAEDAVRLELLAQLQESLSNARALIDLVAEQQRLTGQDPLGAAAYKAALQANAVEEEAIEADLEAYEADPDSEVEELSEASRMLLLQVLGVVDTLDRSQVRWAIPQEREGSCSCNCRHKAGRCSCTKQQWRLGKSVRLLQQHSSMP